MQKVWHLRQMDRCIAIQVSKRNQDMSVSGCMVENHTTNAYGKTIQDNAIRTAG